MKKLISKKNIFKGRLLKLNLEKRRFPNGYVADLEVVEHPGAVLMVPFVGRESIVLIKQYRPVINSFIWELPAGTLHRNESPSLCAKRELKEEIGYSARHLKKIGFIYPAPGYTTERIIVYEARGLRKIGSDIQEDEMITEKILSVREINRLLRRGKIVDAKTIAALKLALD